MSAPSLRERIMRADIKDMEAIAADGDAAIAARDARIAELERELGECQVGYESGTRAVAENLRLQAEVARLSVPVEVKPLTECPDCWRYFDAKVYPESAIRTLQARLAAAEGDTERLDWLQATHNTPWRITSVVWEPVTDGSDRRERREIFEGWSANPANEEPYTTIRAAIDAARHPQTGAQT